MTGGVVLIDKYGVEIENGVLLVERWIKTVCYNYHWSPDIINNMYLDDLDYKGLKYHFDSIVEVNDSIKKSKDKK